MKGISGNLGLGFNVKAVFTASRVTTPLAKAEQRYLRYGSGYILKAARGSIKRKGAARKEPLKFDSKGRKRKAWIRWIREMHDLPASPAPAPPYTHSHVRVALKPSLQRAYGKITQSAVIGPVAYHRRTAQIWRLHEFGGTRRKTITEGEGERETTRTVMAVYPARPFMAPALKRTTPKLPEIWRNSIK